jgi:hypothetical protein
MDGLRDLRTHMGIAIGGLFALLFALLPIAGVFGYVGQNPYVVQMRGPNGPVRCDGTAKVTAKVTDVASGNLVPGQAVHWDFKKSLSNGDKVAPKSTVTDNNAETTVTVSFGNAEGQRTVRAMIAAWPTTIKVSCQGGVTPPDPTPTPTRRPTPTPDDTPKPARTPEPTETQPSEPSPNNSPGTSPSTVAPGTVEPSPTPSLAPSTPEQTAAPSTASPTDTAPTVSPDAGEPTSEPGSVPVPTMTPYTPQVIGQEPAMGMTAFGLIGLVGLVSGVVTFLLLRKR